MPFVAFFPLHDREDLLRLPDLVPDVLDVSFEVEVFVYLNAQVFIALYYGDPRFFVGVCFYFLQGAFVYHDATFFPVYFHAIVI